MNLPVRTFGRSLWNCLFLRSLQKNHALELHLGDSNLDSEEEDENEGQWP